MKQQAPDLNLTFPRSPKENLDGIVHFARIIDKVRAKGAGLIGEYIYPCPLDEMFLGFFEIEAGDFFKAVQGKQDQEIASWLREHGVRRSAAEIANPPMQKNKHIFSNKEIISHPTERMS